MSKLPPISSNGYLEGKFVSIVGYKKNTDGKDLVEYNGNGVVGVCLPSFWHKYLKQNPPRQAGWV